MYDRDLGVSPHYPIIVCHLVNTYAELNDMPKAMNWKNDIVTASPNEMETKYRSDYYDVWWKIQKLTVPQNYELTQSDHIKLSGVANSGTSFSRIACSMLHFYAPEMSNGCFMQAASITKRGSTTNTNEDKEIVIENNIEPYLEDNVPNPFNNTTEIGYYVPDNILNTEIQISDITGKKIVSYCIKPGQGVIEIDASHFTNGIYIYKLIVNGAVIENKKMVVIK